MKNFDPAPNIPKIHKLDSKAIIVAKAGTSLKVKTNNLTKYSPKATESKGGQRNIATITGPLIQVVRGGRCGLISTNVSVN